MGIEVHMSSVTAPTWARSANDADPLSRFEVTRDPLQDQWQAFSVTHPVIREPDVTLGGPRALRAIILYH